MEQALSQDRLGQVARADAPFKQFDQRRDLRIAAADIAGVGPHSRQIEQVCRLAIAALTPLAR